MSPLLDGIFQHPIVTNDSIWMLRNENELNIILAKEVQDVWWSCVLIGDPEIDISNFPDAETEKKRLADIAEANKPKVSTKPCK